MKRAFLSVLLCLVMNCVDLVAIIIETPHFEEILHYVKPDSLVLLDIDDTLLVPAQTLGNDVWFLERVKLHQESKGISRPEAVEYALADWEGVRNLTRMKVVEEGTEQIVGELQRRNITVMGLTTQGIALATRTVLQLNAEQIDLSKTAPSLNDHYFLNGHGVLYRKGILFTSGTPKGKALLKLLDIIGYKPKHIVFINDKETHLKDIEDDVEVAGIEFIGLRYSYSDDRVSNYRPEIAHIQWKHSSFDRILSDEEAEALLQSAHK